MDIMKELDEGLNKLSGADFIECENIERARDNLTPVISLSASFQLRIAALALKKMPSDLEELPMRQLNRILLAVNRFLLGNLEEEKIQFPKLEE